MLRNYLIFLTIAVTACAPRGEIVMAPEAAAIGNVQEILVGTTRGPDNKRSETVHFGRVDVSVPPEREPGTIKYPPKNGTPDLRREFVVTQRLEYADARAFRQALSKELSRQPASHRDGSFSYTAITTPLPKGCTALPNSPMT